MDLEVASGVLATLLSESARARPYEACGLLLGTAARIDGATLCANVAADPARHFEIDPAALIAAHKAERTGGPMLLGYWHSHPSGAPAPSATDRARATRDGRVWAIVAGSKIGWWRDCEDGFVALSTAPVDG